MTSQANRTSSLNLHQIIGNLGRDPETRYTASGTAVTNLSVATTEKWRDQKTGDMREATDWHRVVLFGRPAELAAESLRKGSLVYLAGESKTEKWTDRNGIERFTTKLHAHSIKFLEPRPGTQPKPGGQR